MTVSVLRPCGCSAVLSLQKQTVCVQMAVHYKDPAARACCTDAHMRGRYPRHWGGEERERDSPRFDFMSVFAV